jgi:hypothetical protein
MTQSQASSGPIYDLDFAKQPGSSAVSWPAIFAGAIVAIATSLILLTLATAFGLGAVSPWSGAKVGPSAFTLAGGLWLIVMQWVSSALGGYITGRLRMRWPGVHSHEVFFRDTAHGLLAWAVATVVVAVVAASGVASVADHAAPIATDPSAIEAARKSAIAVAVFTSVSMLIGAFIACVSAAIGGRLRDAHP